MLLANLTIKSEICQLDSSFIQFSPLLFSQLRAAVLNPNRRRPAGFSNNPTPTVQLINMHKEAMGNNSPPPRSKANSFRDSPLSSSPANFAKLQFSTLSSSVDLTHQKRLSLQGLLDYLNQVVEQLYPGDSIGLKGTLREFLQAKAGELRGKLQERLSLLKYLEGSLKYRSFMEIEVEIVKEWRKNALLFSTATIWARCMLSHQFKSEAEFAKEYERFRTLVANISHYYFRSSLKLLHGKGIDTLSLLFDDSAHQVIAGLSDWKEIYVGVLLPLLESPHKATCPEDSEGGKPVHFDLANLKVNPHFLNLAQPDNQLPGTTNYISELAAEWRIHEKVALLKKIRTTFLTEITESNKRLQAELGSTGSQFEKDDIIDCMIYCVVKGGINGLGRSLKALAVLLGKDSELLSKRGVDSYRADLQGAVQYLSEEHSMSTVENSQLAISSPHW